MLFISSWLSSWREARPKHSENARRFRPQVETLEDRCCPSTYTVTEFGDPYYGRDASNWRVVNLNNAEQVATTLLTGGADREHHAYMWDSGTLTDLGTLGGTNSEAWDINDSGDVIGAANTSSGAWHAFISQNGTMTDLGTLGGAGSEATAINNVGQVVGTAETASGGKALFVWEDGVMTDLSSLLPTNRGWTEVRATDINDNGLMVGTAWVPTSAAAGYYESFTIDLNTNDFTLLPAPKKSKGTGIAQALNEAGEIVGESLWKDGKVSGLPGAAFGINNSSQIVGIKLASGKNRFGPPIAYLWENGQATDLNSQIPTNSGVYLYAAYDINDDGYIVGLSESRIFFLTPTSSAASASASSADSVTIASFTADPNPVAAGSATTLTAFDVTTDNAGGTITQVAFYRDSNDNGVLDTDDEHLGDGTQSGDDWSYDYTPSTAAIDKLFAQAADSYGVLSDPLALELTVS